MGEDQPTEFHQRYLFQLARAARFYCRVVEHVPTDPKEATALNAYEDDLEACFVMCWHVKDWVRNDVSLPADVREEMTREVYALPALMLCRDVANGIKHLEVRDNRTGVLGTAALVGCKPDGTLVWKHYIELPDGELTSAPRAARDGLIAWREILQRHGLPLPHLYPV